jgi:hypothetical protein
MGSRTTLHLRALLRCVPPADTSDSTDSCDRLMASCATSCNNSRYGNINTKTVPAPSSYLRASLLARGMLDGRVILKSVTDEVMDYVQKTNTHRQVLTSRSLSESTFLTFCSCSAGWW